MPDNTSPSLVEGFAMQMLERDLLPDPIIRLGIRRLLESRISETARLTEATLEAQQIDLLKQCAASPIAVNTSDANEQHYELPTEFFQLVLGSRLKYSGGYWPRGVTTLDESEELMLAVTCERAAIANGQEILELGCGWGSLTLYLAENFPESRITAVSNSHTQKQHIDAEAAKRCLHNITVITADMNDFEAAAGKFDRVVSVEMFEHIRNHDLLMKRISSWLAPGGLLFVHIFSHTRAAYLFEDKGSWDWMSRYFFSGGMMPSDKWLLNFQTSLRIKDHWQIDGQNYQRTSEAWLERMDANLDSVMEIFTRTYGRQQARKWKVYWRVFFMSCAELFGFRNGREWIISHYLFQKHAT